jgi:uncharacterized membrane protein YebE (DUF533 family)
MPAKTTTKAAKTPGKSGSSGRAHAPVADQDRIISLAGGTYAYIVMADGTSRRLRTSDPEFLPTLASLAEVGYANRIITQLRALAAKAPLTPWPTVLSAYEATLASE